MRPRRLWALVATLLAASCCGAQAPQGVQPATPQLLLPQQAGAQASAAQQQPGTPSGLQQEPVQGLGPAATEVVASCPQNSFYAENFYMGATLLGASNGTDTLGECCVLCSTDQDCTKWTFCPLTSREGCQVPVGPMMGQVFPPGSCLLSGTTAGDGQTRIAYSFMQAGLEWDSGEEAGEDTVVQESAGDNKENWQKLSFNSTEHLFCRRALAGGPAKLAPLLGQGGEGPAVAAGQELRYTGLILADTSGAQWGVVYSNASGAGALWRYPAQQLGFCSATRPGCSAAGDSGRGEEGASCRDAADCCAGLQCTPRGVAGVQVSYRPPGAASLSRSPVFGVEAAADGSGLSLLPKECSRQAGSAMGADASELKFESPSFDGLPIDWCTAPDQGCGQPAAQAFCTAQGYAGAADYAGPTPVPFGNQTVYPATGADCDSAAAAGQCTTFYYILCKA
ncbi:hypothetical protein C2E21_6437 [Chlorella sorokiniana]|uniref:Uncharacterized protein n=1 Tax=Chlorella sorokiniana TaxID=3076 RepID=A0A2P6TLQ8_CHLSO|nr:hypothetical protein C2E21_6437 [Chlorella sorokiniana]|eukprot:PRW45224.1 hypothetical protein C2E21_6437 [Chlorella sorokiniana]